MIKFNTHKDLVVSFSGGQTSAYMAIKLKKEYGNTHNLSFTFANTGQENEATLEFVQRVDEEYNLGVVWVEAMVSEGRKATGYKIVDFKTASRNGEPFEAVIRKYGLPNKSYPHCTRELKLQPMTAYEKQAHPRGYITAIGIRADEYRRPRVDTENIIYPLAGRWITDKRMVNDFWDTQPFKLELEEHQGNCKWCWKKSFRKLYKLAIETPDVFDFPARMEELYSDFIPETQYQTGEMRKIFRGKTSTKQLLKNAINHNTKSTFHLIDIDDGCSESCEVFECI